MSRTLDETLRALGALPADDRETVRHDVMAATRDTLWVPNPGPQTEAYFCPADVLLYGGQGGGGKTDLLAGLALTRHTRSLLLRVQYTDLGALIERVAQIAGTRKGLNAQPPARFKHDGRVIDFGAGSSLEKARTWQGNPHDLIGFDEACQFAEAVIRFLMGWNRAADEDLNAGSQRVRTVLASNPPLSAEGQWVVGMFRPWLDVTHPDPAAPGALRWFVTDPDGHDLEVDGPDDVRDWDGKRHIPKSRTFIPAALGDNPFLADTGYQATLDALAEPVRSAVRDGNFMAAREDDPWQVIPTGWVLAANERWRRGKPPDAAMTALGLDPARGGRDETVLSPRYGLWFDEQTAVPGRQTPDGPSVVALAVGHLRDGAVIGLDAIGVGASVQDHLTSAGIDPAAINSAGRSHKATRDGRFGFLNTRSEMWWSLREALDPDYGLDLALPPDPRLQADLTAPAYAVRPGEPPKIAVEGKDDIVKRLGRSPDRGDALVYAWAAGDLHGDRTRTRRTGPRPDRANTGYTKLRHR